MIVYQAATEKVINIAMALNFIAVNYWKRLYFSVSLTDTENKSLFNH